MYWRVRKISPEQVAKTYGVHAVCVVSVLCNLVMLSKVAPSNKLDQNQTLIFDVFAREVTRHLVDSTFTTYESSTNRLAFSGDKSELGPKPIKFLAQTEAIPGNADAMKAISRQLAETKSVSAIRFKEVKVDEPLKPSGYVPIEVKAEVVAHAADGVQGPQSIRFKYLMGMRGDPALPVVVEFLDLSRQPESQE